MPAAIPPSCARPRYRKRVIRDAISTVRGKVLFFIDACRSGSALDGGLSPVDATAIVNDLTSAENGVVMFSSSTGRQNSEEREEWKNGAFTEVLLAGLTGKADYEEDGVITTNEIDLYLATHVAKLTGNRQKAVMVRPRTITDFALSEVR